MKKPGFKKIPRDAFLYGVKGRLINDVGPYIELVKKVYDETGKGTGFWALARMIFPVVDAVASRIYKKGKQRKPVKLLQKLKVPCPNLVWEIYRHSLIHGDQPRTAVYRKKKVAWRVSIGEGTHERHNTHIAIDLEKCYQDFLIFLDEEIKKGINKSIWIENEIIFNRKISKPLKAEFKLFP